MKDAVLQAAFGQLGDEALYGIQPSRRCRGEVERPARVALQPAPDAGPRLSRGPHDCLRTVTIRREQNDPGTPDVRLSTIAVRYDGFKTNAVLSRDGDRYP